jgi:hypothetical protein
MVNDPDICNIVHTYILSITKVMREFFYDKARGDNK